MKQKPREYNITPAKGQAILNFQGRRFPDKLNYLKQRLLKKSVCR